MAKTKKKFKLLFWSKRVYITGPDECNLVVDIDDVDHALVVSHLQRLMAILEDHWDDEAYAQFVPPPMPDFDDDEAVDKRYNDAMAWLRKHHD